MGAWIVKTPDGYNIPSRFRFIQKSAEWSEDDVFELSRYVEKLGRDYEFNLPNKGYDIHGFSKDILSYIIKRVNVSLNEDDIESMVKVYSDNLPICGEFESYHKALVDSYRQGIVNALKSLKPKK